MEPSSASKTAASTPASSPGLYSPSPPPLQKHFPAMGDSTPSASPYLHPLHKVKETNKVSVEQDFLTGRKLINQYEIIDEIGRGVHGKVKLARSLETGDRVAIKIIQRFSKKRRLGRVTVSPEDKTKREIAILKKVRHPNVVGLLEIIDDPEMKKIYMVLEFVENGEILWRKRGKSPVCLFERRRIEKEIQGDFDGGQESQYFKLRSDRIARKEAARERDSRLQRPLEYWSLEHGITNDDDDGVSLSRHSTQESFLHFAPRSHTSHTSMVRSNPASGNHSRATSRAPSRTSSTAAHTPLPTEFDIGSIDSDNEDDAPGPLPSITSTHSSAAALDAHMSGQVGGQQLRRGRSASTTNSVISNLSSVDDAMHHDAFEEDFSYVPCLSIDRARSTFRDTVLGLEYLHYQGIVHRDIKPANLLWNRDHRVKISDFGVSYFGKPVRDDETAEDVSESDAQDFDDDLELAKTVGTPAFFAPELCYTDIDVEQPKVTEQIDVWSLGVTLYCLIFARIPFLAEDEYQLFRAIAREEVYIPRKRLKAVDPTPPISDSASHVQAAQGPPPNRAYRQENEIVMEDIDDELHDLIRRMLIKDPTERLKLREVKRHPWVLKGIDNVIGWLDDTDPSRKTAGRRIQVDDRELERAVVPITFLERARSAVKKAVGKVIGRSDGSRRRAVSSATSSGTDVSQSSPATPVRDNRRASLRGDESYFVALKEPREPGEHPLAQSVSASPEQPVHDRDLFAQQFLEGNISAMGTPRRKRSETELVQRPGLQDRTTSTAASIQTVIRRLSHSRSFSDSPSSINFPLPQPPGSPFFFTDHHGGIIRDTSRSIHDTRSSQVRNQSCDNPARTRSADRALFNANDKHSGPVVAVSNATAPGNFEHPTPKRHLYSRSTDVTANNSPVLASPHSQPLMLVTHQQSASESNVPNLLERMYAASILDDRPSTANRTPEPSTPAPHIYQGSTPESFARAQEEFDRRRRMEEDKAEEGKQQAKQAVDEARETLAAGCPPSPDDEAFRQKQVEEANRAKSSSSVGSVGMISTFTSPTDMTSPISSITYSSANLDSSQRGSSSDQFFPSDPSLPTLISGASSVSADQEGDFLSSPGTIREPVDVSINTPDTITPPVLSKEHGNEGEHTHELSDLNTLAVVADEDEGYNADGDMAVKTEDDDSDSDEGLTMSRKKPAQTKPTNTLVRRDTNASVGSTETAKKVRMAE